MLRRGAVLISVLVVLVLTAATVFGSGSSAESSADSSVVYEVSYKSKPFRVDLCDMDKITSNAQSSGYQFFESLDSAESIFEKADGRYFKNKGENKIILIPREDFVLGISQYALDPCIWQAAIFVKKENFIIEEARKILSDELQSLEAVQTGLEVEFEKEAIPSAADMMGYISSLYMTNPDVITPQDYITANGSLGGYWVKRWWDYNYGTDTLLMRMTLLYTVRLNYWCGLWWCDFYPIKEREFRHRLYIQRILPTYVNIEEIGGISIDVSSWEEAGPLLMEFGNFTIGDITKDVDIANLSVENSNWTYALISTCYMAVFGFGHRPPNTPDQYDTGWYYDMYNRPRVIEVVECIPECYSNQECCDKHEDCGDLLWRSCNAKDDAVLAYRTYWCQNPGLCEASCEPRTRKETVDCGIDYCGKWSGYYCALNDVYHHRFCHDKGCSDGYCFDNQWQENELVEDCEESEWIDEPTCSNRDNTYEKLWQVYRDAGCENSECYAHQGWELKQDCGQTSYEPWSDNFCSDGNVKHNRTVHYRKCETIWIDTDWFYFCNIHDYTETETVEDCGVDSCDPWGSNYCKYNDVYRSRTCHDRGCSAAACFDNTNTEEMKIQECGSDSCDSWGSWYCSSSTQRERERTCHYRGCSGSDCFDNPWTDAQTENCSAGQVCQDGLCIQFPGDTNHDCKVDVFDLATVGVAFNSQSGDPNWNPDADLNGDSKIDVFDLATVGVNYGNNC